MKVPTQILAMLLVLLPAAVDARPGHNNRHGLQEDSGEFRRGRPGQPRNGDSRRHGDVRLGEPRNRGDACPPGTLAAVLSPDMKTLSLLFDNFLVIAGGDTGSPRTQGTCAVSIPVAVPDGMRVEVVQFDYRGFHSIPRRGQVRYVSRYQFSEFDGSPRGRKRIKRHSRFKGPLEEDFFLSSSIGPAKSLWSGCGQDFTLDVTTEVTALSPSREELLAAVDSLDLVANPHVQYHLRWETCHTR